jgi:hypothetical protein
MNLPARPNTTTEHIRPTEAEYYVSLCAKAEVQLNKLIASDWDDSTEVLLTRMRYCERSHYGFVAAASRYSYPYHEEDDISSEEQRFDYIVGVFLILAEQFGGIITMRDIASKYPQYDIAKRQEKIEAIEYLRDNYIAVDLPDASMEAYRNYILAVQDRYNIRNEAIDLCAKLDAAPKPVIHN